MADAEIRKPGATIAGRQAASVGLASLVSAAAGYLVIWFVPRILTKADNAEFLAFWSALFLLFGVLGGIQTETIRYVTAGSPADAARVPRADTGKDVPLISVVLAVSVAVSVILATTSFLWGP